jgi:hypothetical protein
LEPEVLKNDNLIKVSLRGWFFWQEVYFEQAEFFDRVFWQEVPVRRSGVDFIADNNSIASGSVAGK